ncbi:MAG: hypothetical protein HUK21_11790 [Fibrobacteraceae bacterium]|nr:hypothetical protein [Fibrobacteraceae bacterium]
MNKSQKFAVELFSIATSNLLKKFKKQMTMKEFKDVLETCTKNKYYTTKGLPQLKSDLEAIKGYFDISVFKE